MNFARLIQISVQPHSSNGLTQLPSYVPIQQDDPDMQPNIQGSYPGLQDGGVLQNSRGSYATQEGDLSQGVRHYYLNRLANYDAIYQKALMDEVPPGNQTAARKALGQDTWQQRFKPNAPLDKNFIPQKHGSTVNFDGGLPDNPLAHILYKVGETENKVASTVSKKVAHPIMSFLKHIF